MEEDTKEKDEAISDNRDQCSTSSASEPTSSRENNSAKNDEEIFRLLKVTDELLENKAKSMNLSSLNVRSILHHLIKYPSTIDVLLGIRETDDLPSVRNTRSRKKADESSSSSTFNTPKKFALRIEDKGPKNFLDLEYEEDDEYDDDYVGEEEEGKPMKDDADAGDSDDEENDFDEEDEEEEEEEEEGGDGDGDGRELDDKEQKDTSGIALAETSTRSQNDLFFEFFGDNSNITDDDYAMHMTLNDTRAGSTAPLHTLDNVVDDDDYRNFVHSLQYPPEDAVDQTVYDTEDDPEDEDYNVIADNLNVEDWYETRQDKTTMIPKHEVKALMMDTLLAEKEIPINVFPEEAIHPDEFRKSRKDKDAEVCERINEYAVTSTESCSLISQNPVSFRSEELDQLILQLEQHVQILTQFVVTCHHDSQLAHVRNSAQLMINELDDIRQQRNSPTIFDVSNLDAAIESCHDINAFDAVDESLVKYSPSVDCQGGYALRPEAAAVLSRSRAIRFPELLPLCQPALIELPIQFLSEEDVMLAVALLQFAHLPRRAERGGIDRYTAIHQYCLPAKTAYKIRTHLKTMRKASKNPIHSIIQAAEQGICNVSVPKKVWCHTNSPIELWPISSQPKWYHQFLKTFHVTEDRQILRKDETAVVLTPVKNKMGNSRVGTETSDDLEFVDIGRGHDGRTIVMDREHIQDLVSQLIKESEISPSKRRKNPTPMKLSTMGIIEAAERQVDNESEDLNDPYLPKQTASSSSAVTEINCNNGISSKTSNSEKLPTTSRHYDFPPVHAPSNLLKSEANGAPGFSLDRQSFNDPESSNTVLFRDHICIKDIPSNQESQLTITSDISNNLEFNTNSCLSFPIPITPGRRSPDEHDEYFMDLESNSLMWNQTQFSVTLGNPLTPRDFSSDVTDPIDFSSMGSSTLPDSDNIKSQTSMCQIPIECCSNFSETTSSQSLPQGSVKHRTVSESATEDDTSMPGLDLVPPDEEEESAVENVVENEGLIVEQVPVKQGLVNSRPPLRFKKEVQAGNTNLAPSRKRTRNEREAMGSVGLEDESLHEQQKSIIVRKIMEDISQRLFMHKDTYQRFKIAMTDKKMTDVEKVSRIALVLANHPELLNLVLLFAPPDAVSEFQCDPNYQSYKSAIEMIMNIERYITSAKLKEPSLRGLFRYIQSYLKDDPNLGDEQATRKFYQLFGQDRPLWKKLESHFWCLPYEPKPRLENYEYIDLTKIETMSKKEKREWNSIPPRFETVDDIDAALGCSYKPPKNEPASNLVVKCGEFCIRKDDETYIQLEITERHWTRKDDITLLTSYNEALKTIPNFTESLIPSLVPDLPFGEKSIVARLQYLLAELKALD